MKGRVDESKESSQSSRIDRQLHRLRLKEEHKIKLLLLGPEESGKSTIIKIIRFLYGQPCTDDELRMYGVVVRSNIVTAMRKLCAHLRTLGLEDSLANEEDIRDGDGQTQPPKQAYDLLLSHLVDGTASPIEDGAPEDDWVGLSSPSAGAEANKDAKLFLQLWKTIKILWESQTMKQVWKRRAAANVIDGHRELLNDISLIASPTFRPSEKHILLARKKTTRVVVERCRIDGIDYELYDVGGQRSARRRWIEYFDRVDGVIFVASLSEYDQHMGEKRRTNRMVESLDLFRSVINNRIFSNTAILLFLNKQDVFREKLQYDIVTQKAFSDFSGPPKDFDAGVEYFKSKFRGCLVGGDLPEAVVHTTCATDARSMEFVLDCMRNIVILSSRGE